MTNPTTPASGDELSDERIAELYYASAMGSQYDGGANAFARAVIEADRAARQAPVVPAGMWLAPMEPDEQMCEHGDDEIETLQIFYRMRDSWLSRHPAPASPLQQAQDGELDTERLDWLQRDMLFSEPTGITWEDGAFCFPYLVSGDGGLGGGVGMARFRSLREAIDAARSQSDTARKEGANP